MMNWADKVAIVTGGSAGLGYHLAQALLARDARVTIVGRDRDRLQQARESLLQGKYPPDSLLTVAADVTADADVARIVAKTHEQFGRLDLLVNCAGRSMRGLASQVTVDEMRDLFELNTVAAMRCCQHALPYLRKSQGQIINIGSLASRIATPNLGAYPASKFGLAAYSEQLRRELGPEGVHVLTVFPGPISRLDAGARYADQTAQMGETASRPGGSRLKSMSPASLVAGILKAASRRRAEWMPLKARLFCLIALCSPKLGDWIARKMTS